MSKYRSTTPAAGYALDTLTVKQGETDVTVENNQFTMPAGDVTVSATFREIDYAIDTSGITNGTVTMQVGQTENVTTAHYSDTVTLAATPAAGYALGSWDVRDAENNPVTVTNDAFTMPASDVTVSALFLKKAENVPYIDADGSPATQDAYILEGDHSTLPGGWYYVPEGSVSYPAGITFTGDANLILADGCNLTVGSANDETVISGLMVWDSATSTIKDLTVYGQSGQTGRLTATGSYIGIQADDVAIYGGDIEAKSAETGYYGLYGTSSVTIARGSVTARGGNGIVAFPKGGGQATVTITGGTVNATATGQNGFGISGKDSLTISGGTVNATGTGQAYAIGGVGDVSVTGGNVTATCENGQGFYSADGNITLGWTNATDSIKANRYYVNTGKNKTVSVQTGKYLYDAAGKVYYSGDITGNADDLKNVTLTPANIIIEASEHGSVATESGVYYAAKDDTVTLTVKPDASYELASLKVNGTEKKDEVSDDIPRIS